MSDYHYVSATIRSCDLPIFEELGFEIEWDDSDNGIIEVYHTDMNWGPDGKMPKEIPWTGWSDGGNESRPFLMVSEGKGKDFEEFPSNVIHYPSIEMDFDGVINPVQVENARKFVELFNRVEKEMKEFEPE